ncbi:MAG: YebC/PmpR family DNA-binding transcriptional regulator [bacterium]|nr:YebC/PmpR family DNA-binding transcriptional regulator [bacterium]
MSGHSKWSQIKHKKSSTDAKKGQLFSKLVKEITVAAKVGGANPDNNARLRSAIERGKSLGLPKDNIERALQRTSGAEAGIDLQEFTYEILGPGGVFMIVTGITDNKNRSLAEIKKILGMFSAKLTNPGSLIWNFERDGQSFTPKTHVEANPQDREILDKLLELLKEHEDIQEIYTNIK